MPRTTDSDNLGGQTIKFSGTADCPQSDCGTMIDVQYDTGKYDEDGLTDLDPDDLVAQVKCPHCGHEFEAVYEGWVNYGDA